jgi:hypothetical protein
MTGRTRNRLVAAGAILAGLLAGCQNGELNILGYSTAPPFDPSIRSVYIPVFKAIPFYTNPYRGIDVDLTQAVVEELNRRRSPMRIVSDPARADTELVGTITSINKIPLNRNLQNENREYNVIITAEVVWRDLRSGRVLSGSRVPAPKTDMPFDPSLPPDAPPPPDKVAIPVAVTGTGRALPELGESNTSAAQMAIQQLAQQIVNMMERPWNISAAPPPPR